MTPTHSHQRLARAGAVVGLGTLLSRITGFLRVSALVALGLGPVTDVYNIANSTPNIVYELLLGGILTATLVPLFVESHERDDRTATDAINTMAITLLVVGTLLGVLAAPWIVRAFEVGGHARHLSGAELGQRRALATDLLRWFMPQMLFYGITALATAMLNARRRFAAAAFAPVLNNIVVIAMLLAVGRATTAATTVHSVLDDPVLVLLLGLGTTAGVVAMTVVLGPALHRAGAGFQWRWAPSHPAVRRLTRLSGWTIGYVAANQVAFFVVLVLAWRTDRDVTIYLAAFTFFQLPHGLLAVSVMTALAPELASRHQADDIDGLRDHFAGGLRMILIVMIPAAVGLAVLARPLISALLDHGRFTTASITPTANTLRAFAVGLVAFSVYLYVIRTFSSMQDTRSTFVINLVENGVNIATAFAFYEWRGVEGLAWSWTVAYTVGAVFALAMLRRRLVRVDGGATAATAVRVLLATVPTAGVAIAVDAAVGSASPGPALVTVVGAGLAATVVFVITTKLLGIDLVGLARGILRREGRTANALHG